LAFTKLEEFGLVTNVRVKKMLIEGA